MSPSDVAAALRSRGIVLNPGLDDTMIDQLLRTSGWTIDDYVRDIFRNFDGFGTGHMDSGSYIRAWPLSRVIEDNPSKTSRVSFADFLMESNEYTMCIDNSSEPVLMDGETIAASLREFWTLLIQGRLDA